MDIFDDWDDLQAWLRSTPAELAHERAPAVVTAGVAAADLVGTGMMDLVQAATHPLSISRHQNR